MTANAPHVLYVEDDQVDQMALTRALNSTRLAISVVDSVAAAREAMARQSFDVVVSDLHLGDGTALDVLSAAGDTPVIVVTGMGDEQTAVQALKRGAYDYLIKDAHLQYLEALPLAIDSAIAHREAEVALARSEARQKQLFAEVEKSHQDLLAILDEMHVGVVVLDPAGQVSFVSRMFRTMVQKDEGALLGRDWNSVCPLTAEHRERLDAVSAQSPNERERLAVHFTPSAGRQYHVEVDVQDDPRNPGGRIFFLYDVTAVQDLRRLLHDKAAAFGIVGSSPSMQVVFEQIDQLSRHDTTILIEGATGTGKELVARAVHQSGHRRDKPFIALNCAGLTESLLASQLFGHRRGAFTGAVDDQPGHFEAAHGGTLFLDEIGDISPSVQTSLLRVLQEKEILRIGESTPRKVDVRIVTATHRDLNEEVRAGRFRADLLYRIRVARITLPPLQDRRTDIPLLVETFLRAFRASSGKAVEGIANQALRRLMDYHWPGNVRELQSAVEFAAIRARDAIIRNEDLPPEISTPAVMPAVGRLDHEDERQRICAALEQAGGNRTAAARLLSMSRATFYRRLSALDITPEVAGDRR